MVGLVGGGKQTFGHDSAKFGYNPGLDGLRTVSVAAVIAGHGLYHAPGGFYGVTVFFVISGYLITSLLLAEYAKTGAIRFGHFYWRRFARLGPALIVVVLVTVVFLLATRVPIATWWGGAVGSLTYSTDLIAAFLNNHAVSQNFEYTWSLGIEEQFYLFWPLLLLLLLRWGKLVPTLILLVVGMGATWIVRSFEVTHGAAPWVVYYGPFSHTDALLLGCGIAIVLTRFPTSVVLRRMSQIAGPIGVLILGVIFLYGAIPYFPDQYGLSALAAGAVVIWVAILPNGWFGRAIGWAPLAFLGRLSYSLYLWNIVLLWSFVDVFGVRPKESPLGFLWLIAVVGVAYLSYRFVEQPLRRRWAPPQVHAIVTASAQPVGAAQNDAVANEPRATTS